MANPATISLKDSKVSVEAIENLGLIAKQLVTGKGLTIPGNVKITGTLQVDKNVGIRNV